MVLFGVAEASEICGMAATEIPHQHELVAFISEEHEDTAINGGTQQEVLLLNIHNLADLLILLDIFQWFQFLDELSSLSRVLSQEASCITDV